MNNTNSSKYKQKNFAEIKNWGTSHSEIKIKFYF